MERAKIARSAKWGSACGSCAAAKTRCIRSTPSAAKCDRCRSLEKHCSNQVPGPRKKRQSKPLKTSQLDERLNDLISSLKASEKEESPTDPGSWANDSIHGQDAKNQPLSLGDTNVHGRNDPAVNEADRNIPVYDVGSAPPAFPTCICKTPVSKDDLVPTESDEILLSIYMNQLSARFPFVIIPAGTTPKQLQVTRPLLMKVIRMVGSVRNLSSMRGQSRAVMKHISNVMLMHSERSLDLLQGIIVFLGFYHHHCLAHAQFNNLSHLLASLVGDMELGVGPQHQNRKNGLPLQRAEEARSRTNEEKRALLGAWYMSSNAGLVKSSAPMKYTKYFEQCLKDLEGVAEYETDQLLIQIVRVQHLTERIIQFHNRDQLMDEAQVMPEPSIPKCLESFQAELNKLQNSIPSTLKSDYFLFSHYNSARLRLYQPLLELPHLPDADSHSLASLSFSGVSALDIFTLFTSSIKSWFDNWLAMPVCSYFYMPQPFSSQLIHASVLIARWGRVAGARAVKASRSGAPPSVKEAMHPRPPLPAFSGVPSCPDWSVTQAPAPSSFNSSISGQIMNALRDQILAQPELQFDVFAIADAMITRFEAAKKEMAAAQGGVWKNNMWDFAAEQMKTKEARFEKWCQSVTTAASDKAIQRNFVSNNPEQRNGEAMNTAEGQQINDLGWQASYEYPGYMQWESDLFDQIMNESHPNAFLDSWDAWADEMDLLDRSNLEL